MSKILITDIIDGDHNEFRNFVLEVRLSDPETTPTQGQFYYNSSTSLLRYYTGKEWKSVGTVEGLTPIISTNSSILTTTTEGVVDLIVNFAEGLEVYDETIGNKSISPKTLSNRVATEEATGMLRIATQEIADEGQSHEHIMTPKTVAKVVKDITLDIVNENKVTKTSELINDGEFPDKEGKYVEDVDLPDIINQVIVVEGLGDKNTVIPIPVNSDTWEEIHDLNKVCSITTTNVNGFEIKGQILINDGVRVKVKFNSPQQGELILN